MAQLPDTLQENIGSIANDAKIQEVLSGFFGPIGGELPCYDISSEHLRHLDVKQMGRVQSFSPQ